MVRNPVNNKKKAQLASSQPIQASQNAEIEVSNQSAYGNITVKALKEILVTRKLPVSGKNKAELVARLVATDDVGEVVNRLESISLGIVGNQAAQP